MTEAVAALDRIRTAVPRLTVLVLHHLNASGSRERGSTVFRGAVDTQLRLRRPKQKGSGSEPEDDDAATGDCVRLGVDKQKDLDEIRPLLLNKMEITIPNEYEHSGRPSTSLVFVREHDDMPLADRVIAFVRQNPGATKRAVCESVSGRTAVVTMVIADLEKAGRIRVTPHGREHRIYLVA